jgi:hypothetical protein
MLRCDWPIRLTHAGQLGTYLSCRTSRARVSQPETLARETHLISPAGLSFSPGKMNTRHPFLMQGVKC